MTLRWNRATFAGVQSPPFRDEVHGRSLALRGKPRNPRKGRPCRWDALCASMYYGNRGTKHSITGNGCKKGRLPCGIKYGTGLCPITGVQSPPLRRDVLSREMALPGEVTDYLRGGFLGDTHSVCPCCKAMRMPGQILADPGGGRVPPRVGVPGKWPDGDGV